MEELSILTKYLVPALIALDIIILLVLRKMNIKIDAVAFLQLVERMDGEDSEQE